MIKVRDVMLFRVVRWYVSGVSNMYNYSTTNETIYCKARTMQEVLDKYPSATLIERLGVVEDLV